MISTPTLLVFRDKHTQEVQNYAIVGGTVWIFSEQRATKLPLSWLDIEATAKANEDRGVNFQVQDRHSWERGLQGGRGRLAPASCFCG